MVLVLVLIVIAIPFGIWWHFEAPCDTVVRFSQTIHDVPPRCLTIVK